MIIWCTRTQSCSGESRRHFEKLQTALGSYLQAPSRLSWVTDLFGRTPLHFASVNGHNAVAETLLEKGGEVNAKDDEGWTAMHRAAWMGHTAVLEVLREGGADVDAADGEGDTPLHKAASKGHLLAIFMLTNFGASTYKKNKSGRTPRDLMPRSSSTESRGMELFQSVSMVIDCIDTRDARLGCNREGKDQIAKRNPSAEAFCLENLELPE
ncbi:ankyrin repeat domain-containing protein 39-like [Penaeus japonicus]|uniref:ankyrin repeat domain-containing protein 39-like n=1 Tax=Penaeus japonicus TaxID=27405 RepID=UPI001C70FC0A|nr:ankyrin repeat domain-containing protein 39-like [Penaeus japonicus]